VQKGSIWFCVQYKLFLLSPLKYVWLNRFNFQYYDWKWDRFKSKQSIIIHIGYMLSCYLRIDQLRDHGVIVLHRKPCICDNFLCVICPTEKIAQMRRVFFEELTISYHMSRSPAGVWHYWKIDRTIGGANEQTWTLIIFIYGELCPDLEVIIKSGNTSVPYFEPCR